MPPFQFHLSQFSMFKCHVFIRYRPRIRFFEGKTFPMYSWPSTLSLLWWLGILIQYAISAQPRYDTTILALKGPIKLCITIFGIGCHNIEYIL